MALAMASLLLTRPVPQSERFLALLDRAVPTVISPLMEIEPLDPPMPRGLAGVIVTSGHGAEALARLEVDRDVPVFAVGSHTADAARRAGHPTVSADGNADDLVRMILQRRPAGPLVHLRGERTRGDVAELLAAAGLETAEVVAYRQVAMPLGVEARQLLAGRDVVVAPLFSPETGSMFAGQGPFAAPLRLVCMSEAVAREVVGLAAEGVTIAERPDAAAMASATRAALRA